MIEPHPDSMSRRRDGLVRAVARFRTDVRGATAIEYAMIAAIISIAAVGAIGAIGQTVKTDFYEQIEKGFR